ncbi:MAG: helix-turn-helix transcriptional regulator [Bacillota bacterium]
MEVQEKFTIRVKELMFENQINQRQLSIQCKIPYTTINGWFNKNQRPTIDYLEKIAIFFNCTTDFLIGRENDFGVIEYKTQPKKLSREDEEMKQFWEALEKEYRWKLLGRAAAILEEQQQRYK